VAATGILSTTVLDLMIDQATGDLATGSDGGLQYISGPDGVVQLVAIACRTVAGEWFADLDQGVPYFERQDIVTPDQAIIGQPFDAQKAHDAIVAAIASVPTIVAVGAIAVSYDGDARQVSITGSATYQFADTPAGDIDIDVQVQVST
jgi:hypothetical protein